MQSMASEKFSEKALGNQMNVSRDDPKMQRIEFLQNEIQQFL